MGGRIEVVDFLIKNGANVNATIQVQDNRIHLGIVEVALIRKDIDLLLFLYVNGVPNVCKRLRALMISEKIENKSREACVQVVETVVHEYYKLREKSKITIKAGLKAQDSDCLVTTTPMERMAAEVVSAVEFGRCLAVLLELCRDNVNCMINFVQIFTHAFGDTEIRSKFCKENGIEIIMNFVKGHITELNKRITQFKKRQKYLSTSVIRSSFDSDEEIDETNLFVADFETDVKCACIGKIVGVFSSYEDCLEMLNSSDFKHNEKIITYVWSLFEWNSIRVEYESNSNSQDTQRSKVTKEKNFDDLINQRLY